MRSGEGHIQLNGAWMKIVLVTPGAGEIHVKDLPEGASISLSDGLVLQVWQGKLFGNRGRNIDVNEEAQKFQHRWHETLYFKRLLDSSDDPDVLRRAVERGWAVETRAVLGFMKRNPGIAQRVYEEMKHATNPIKAATQTMLLRGITDEAELMAGVKSVFTGHAALPRLLEVASLETALDGVEVALEVAGGRTVAFWCQNLPESLIEKVLTGLLQRAERADESKRREKEGALSTFVIGGPDPYRVESSGAIAAAAVRMIGRGVVFPERAMKAEGQLRIRALKAKPNVLVDPLKYPLDDTPTGLWKRVGEKTPNGAWRVTSRRGRVACVLELPDDAEELQELLESEDVAVRRAALERIGDETQWIEALDDDTWGGYMAERAPRELLFAYAQGDENEMNDTLVQVARERGCLPEARAEGLTCSVQGLYTAMNSQDAAELDAVLRAAVDDEREAAVEDWVLPVRIIDAVVARSRDQEQLKWLSEALAPRDTTHYFMPRIKTRVRELELAELAWQAKAKGELLMARGAISLLEAEDLLWEMNGDPELSRYAGERLLAALNIPEPF